MTVDWKQRAIEQWTADPCGPPAGDARELLRGRRAYAPWLAGELDYRGAAGLEVLDVGCGQGIDLCEYALAGARATGIDLTPRHVELARLHLEQLGLGAEVHHGDAERLPFADASFDRISSNGVLHHTPDVLSAVKEIHRALRPSGRATIVVYNRDSVHYWLDQVIRSGILKGLWFRERSMARVLSMNVERTTIGARPLVDVYTRRSLVRLMGDAGFARVTTRVSPFMPDESALGRLIRRPTARLPGWYVIAEAYR